MSTAVRLKEVPSILARAYLAKTNVFLRGKPGIGKTETVQAFADEMRKKVESFQLWTFYGSSLSPTDIQCAMPNMETGALTVYNNDRLPNAYKDPDATGVVFIGEMPNTDPATLKLLQKYVNGEDMNGLRKPADVIVVADGNRIEDKSGVMQQGRAFMSRFMSLVCYANAEDCQTYALGKGWHPSVQSFFQGFPQLIDNYDQVFGIEAPAEDDSAGKGSKLTRSQIGMATEEGRSGIWANMRSWKRVSDLESIADKSGTTLTFAEVAGSVGTAVAAQYRTHKDMLGKLATLEEVIADPENVAVPKKMDELYALSMVLAVRCTTAQVKPVSVFAQRMPLDIQAFMLRTMIQRKNDLNLVSLPEYTKWISNPQLNVLIAGASR